MRSVSLRRTLSQPCSFWFAEPHGRSTAERQQLFSASVPASRFDMFLSHTWQTHGAWKFLSLLLHFGWPVLLTCWGCGVLLAFSLCMGGWLPLFNTLQVTALGFTGQVIPSGCWIQIFGLLGILMGCVLVPYVPLKSDQCFLDFACIHQTDSSQMKQGIMSISSFLKASEELRVLWSEPLLSRLWCVFEIAAFRKLKPEGKIVIAPVTNEFFACMMFLWWQIACPAFWLARGGAGGGRIQTILPALASVLCILMPASALAISRNHRSCEKLKSDLANFDVKSVKCSNDFDRDCIHDAITTWYGSLDAFSAYVRGPFSQEILDLMRTSGSVSSHYLILPITPLICLASDQVLALWKAGAPAQTVISFFFCHVVCLALLFFPAMGIFFTWITKRGLRFGKCRCQPMVEVCIILAVCVIFSVAGSFFAIVATSRSFGMTIVWYSFTLLFAGGIWRFCWHDRPEELTSSQCHVASHVNTA